MASHRPAVFVQCLTDFVETQPGTRFGTVFGRPAAFAGHQVFAEVTVERVSCCLPPEVVARSRRLGRLLRVGHGRGWVVVTGVRADRGLSVHALLEVAAAHVATTHRPPPHR